MASGIEMQAEPTDRFPNLHGFATAAAQGAGRITYHSTPGDAAATPPGLQAVIFWDSLVSCLRVYSEAELAELVRSLAAPDYRFHIGSIPIADGPLVATYLWGAPEELLQAPR